VKTAGKYTTLKQTLLDEDQQRGLSSGKGHIGEIKSEQGKRGNPARRPLLQTRCKSARGPRFLSKNLLEHASRQIKRTSEQRLDPKPRKKKREQAKPSLPTFDNAKFCRGARGYEGLLDAREDLRKKTLNLLGKPEERGKKRKT